MSTVITATYENGVLRPLRPINFKEHQAIHLQVLSEEPLSEREIVIQKLIQAGAIAPPRGYSEIEPISEEERRQLADELGQMSGKPLSEIIIEARGEW
jgi:predicted DNA-binding antitoxin AbrB/MazE fold protein